VHCCNSTNLVCPNLATAFVYPGIARNVKSVELFQSFQHTHASLQVCYESTGTPLPDTESNLNWRGNKSCKPLCQQQSSPGWSHEWAQNHSKSELDNRKGVSPNLILGDLTSLHLKVVVQPPQVSCSVPNPRRRLSGNGTYLSQLQQYCA
jgi:hypothetical protein